MGKKWTVFSFARPATNCQPAKPPRNCHLPGSSLAEQLPPTLIGGAECDPEIVVQSRDVISSSKFVLTLNIAVAGRQQRTFRVLVRSLLHGTVPTIRRQPVRVKDAALTRGGRMSV